MMSEVAFFVKDVVGPKGCVSIVKDPNEATAAGSDDIDSHTKTNCIRLHHSALDASNEFVSPDEFINTEDEPDHQALCDREQAYLLRAIQEDLDLSAHMHDAVNSLRIVLAAERVRPDRAGGDACERFRDVVVRRSVSEGGSRRTRSPNVFLPAFSPSRSRKRRRHRSPSCSRPNCGQHHHGSRRGTARQLAQRTSSSTCDGKFYDGGMINRAVRPDNTTRNDVEIQVIQFQSDPARRPTVSADSARTDERHRAETPGRRVLDGASGPDSDVVRSRS